MFTTPKMRTLAAGSALALAAAGSAMLASPATAAESGLLNYTCNFPVLGDRTVTGKHVIDDSVVYGGTVGVSSDITIPEDVRAGLHDLLLAREVAGSITNQAKAANLLDIAVEQVIPKTAVPSSGTMTLTARGGVDTTPYVAAAPAGASINIGLNDRADAPEIEAELFTYTAEGTEAGPLPVPCELIDGQNLAIGDVAVVQAKTKTAAKLAYKKKAKKMVAKVTLDARQSGATVDGTVKFTLKRGKKTVGNKTVELKANEKAKAVFKKVKKSGKYKVVAKYVGTDNFVKSKGNAKKKI